MTWSQPTLEEIRKAYEDGEFDYRVSPSIGLLLDRLQDCEEALRAIADADEDEWEHKLARAALDTDEKP